MSTREQVHYIVDCLSEEQLQGLIMLLRGYSAPDIEEIEPDEWDIEMIKRAEAENNGETISIEDFSKELGIDYDSL